MQAVSVLVAEKNADWLGWARALRRCASNLIVLTQSSGEDHAAFSHRVSARFARLRRDGVPIREAAYVSGDNGIAPAISENRSKLLRRLSALLAASGAKARLYLDPRSRGGGKESSAPMRALAWALTDLTRGSALSIQLAAPPPGAHG